MFSGHNICIQRIEYQVIGDHYLGLAQCTVLGYLSSDDSFNGVLSLIEFCAVWCP